MSKVGQTSKSKERFVTVQYNACGDHLAGFKFRLITPRRIPTCFTLGKNVKWGLSGCRKVPDGYMDTLLYV